MTGMRELVAKLHSLLSELPVSGKWAWHRQFAEHEGDREGSIFAQPREGIAVAIAMRPRYAPAEHWAAEAALIVETHNALPDLLSAIDRLSTQVEELRGALRPFADATLLHQSAVIVAGDGITQAFDSGKKHVTCLMEEDAAPVFNRARALASEQTGG